MTDQQNFDQAAKVYDVDVVVAGSGVGGLSAAIAAAEAGARVLVVEIDTVTGGSSAMSAGGIHLGGATSYEEYLQNTRGMHDAAFSKVYYNGFIEYTAWLKRIGAAVWSYPPPALNINMGSDPNAPSQQQCREYFDSLERIFASFNGQILLKHRVRKILTDARGRITGLRAQRWTSSPSETDGEIVDVRAEKVVLAMGGFQNNKELCSRYIGPEADLISPVGSPYHRGEGMILGQQVGASLSKSMSGIYGAYMSAYPAVNPMDDPEGWARASAADKTELFNLLCFTVPPGFVAVNLNGVRYVDESQPRYKVIQATARQPRAMGIMLFDDAMYSEVADQRILMPGTGASEREKFITRERLEGSRLIQADSLEALADELAKVGPHETYRAKLLKTLEEVNRAAEAGTHELDVYKADLRKLVKPPFYAWPFTAGVVYTMGGLAINTSAQVLDQQRAPIPGLYASPPCAGGVFREYYAGAIGSAGVFGLIAGTHAAANL